MSDETARPSFAICVSNGDHQDLSLGMIYRVLPDEAGAAEGLVRVIDDSGEGYLYPARCFMAVEVDRSDVPKILPVAPAEVA